MSRRGVLLRPLERPPDACVRVPGSKSLTNRALLVAALADGESVLDGALFSDDTMYMAGALRRLGVPIEEDRAGRCFRVTGCGGRWPARDAGLEIGNAGTAARFLVAALCLGEGSYRLDGTPRMRERPIQDLVDALRGLGARVRCENDTGCPPVLVDAAGLPGGATEVRGERSSQFLSALLLAAPYARAPVRVSVRGELIAKPYVDMTIAVMRAFGVDVERDGYREFRVAGSRRYRARSYPIEPDASAAQYFLAAAALTEGRVRVDGLRRDSLQGDARFADILERMGATVTWEDAAVEVAGPPQLHGLDADLNAVSDTAATVAVLGPFAAGAVRVRNIEHLRWQESDRLHAVATELTRLGARVEEQRDGLAVYPSVLQGGEVRTYDDHRIAMSFALLGLKVPGIRILNPECVAKTVPGYFEMLEELRR